MDPFADLQQLFASGDPELGHLPLGVMAVRLSVAVAVGTVLATRPWRLPMRQPLPKTEMIHAQLLLCVAAALITAVIGNSVAKAFGLAGLGGFVRFRSGLKDPRDAAVLFVLIGLGMACGHGSLGIAAAGVAFVGGVLLVLDALPTRPAPQPASRFRVSAESEDPLEAERHLRRALGERNVLVRGCALDFENKRLELELEEREPGAVAAAMAGAQHPSLRGLRWGQPPDKDGEKEERA